MHLSLDPLRTFIAERPVAYGVPVAAVLGIVFGLLLRIGDQTAVPPLAMARLPVPAEELPTLIAWPNDQLPDYVVGTDFLKAQDVHAFADAALEPSYPNLELPPYFEAGQRPPAARLPARPEALPSGSAARDGDILDVSLPEDRLTPMDEQAQD